MNDGPRSDRAVLDNSLQRLETLIAALDDVADRKARESARAMLKLLLDLHGLAFARMNAIIAAAENGAALTGQLGADPHVGAILMLHGLHPQDPGQRVDAMISRMQAQWQSRGLRVDLVGVGTSSARVRVRRNANSEEPQQLRREVEGILVDAAPDLDKIIVEIEEVTVEADGTDGAAGVAATATAPAPAEMALS